MRVIVEEDDTVPLVNVALAVHGGPRGEPPGKPGIAHFVEHLVLFRGSGDRTGQAIAEDLARRGVSLNGRTTRDATIYEMSMPAAEVANALSTLAEIVFHPSLSARGIQEEMPVIREEIRREEDRPKAYVLELAMRTLYGPHPYGRPVQGTIEAIEKIERASVLDYHRTHYLSNNMTLVIVGNVDTEEASRRARDAFGRFPEGTRPLDPLPPVPKPRQYRVVHPRDVNQAYIALAFLGAPSSSPDVPLLELLAAALGSGTESILYRSMVDDLGIASSVEADFLAGKGEGALVVRASLRPENVDAAEREILRQIERARRGGIDGQVLEQARSQIRGETILRSEKGMDRALMLARTDAMDDYTLWLRYPDRIERVHGDELRRVAQIYLAGDAYVFAAVLPHGAPFPTGPPPPARTAERSQVIREGLTILTESMPGRDVVSLEVLVEGGAASDPPGLAGLSSFVARAVLRGPRGVGAAEFDRELRSYGALVEAGADRDFSFLRATVDGGAFPETLRAMGRAIAEPSFEPKEMDALRRQIEGEWYDRSGDSYELADRIFWEKAFGSGPYGQPPGGTPESLRRITNGDILSYYRTHYHRRGVILSIVGNHPVEVLREWAHKAFDPLPRGPEESLWFSGVASPGRPTGRSGARNRDSGQALVMVGYPMGPFEEEAYPAVALLAHLLGGDTSSRLWGTLRQERSLAYTVRAEYEIHRLGGYLRAYAEVSTENAEEALGVLRGEMERLRREQIPQEEVEKAQSSFLARWARRRETRRARAHLNASFAFMELGADYISGLDGRIRALTASDLERLGREVIRPEAEIVVAVGQGVEERFSGPRRGAR